VTVHASSYSRSTEESYSIRKIRASYEEVGATCLHGPHVVHESGEEIKSCLQYCCAEQCGDACQRRPPPKVGSERAYRIWEYLH